MTQEALKLALEWFKCYADHSMSRNNAEALADEVVEAIEKALAQEQDGQCKRCKDGCPACDARKLREQESVADDFFRMIADRNPNPFPPPQRTEQLKACVYCGQLVAKEKNT